MAPDINTMAEWATDGYANNGVPRADYEIPGECHTLSLCSLLLLQRRRVASSMDVLRFSGSWNLVWSI